MNKKIVFFLALFIAGAAHAQLSINKNVEGALILFSIGHPVTGLDDPILKKVNMLDPCFPQAALVWAEHDGQIYSSLCFFRPDKAAWYYLTDMFRGETVLAVEQVPSDTSVVVMVTQSLVLQGQEKRFPVYFFESVQGNSFQIAGTVGIKFSQARKNVLCAIKKEENF